MTTDELVTTLETILARLDKLSKLVESDGLMLSAADTAKTLGVSRSLLYEMKNAGLLPAPISFGRRLCWSKDELRAWIGAGCPAADRWEVLKKRKAV